MADENAVLQLRLTMVQAFAQMLGKAYDALLNWGINYRNLPEFADYEEVAEKVNTLPIERGRALFVTWVGKVEGAIAAAIRRKQFRKV